MFSFPGTTDTIVSLPTIVSPTPEMVGERENKERLSLGSCRLEAGIQSHLQNDNRLNVAASLK